MSWNQEISNLIDNIYECVLHDGEWAPFMWRLSRNFDCSDAFYFVYCSADNQFLDGLFCRLNQKERCPTEPILFHEQPNIFETELLHLFRDDPSYPNLFDLNSPPFNLHLWEEERFRLFSTLPISSNRVVGFALHRPGRRQAFEPEHLQRLQQLVHHLSRALCIQRRINHLESNTLHIASALNCIPTATLLVDSQLQLLCCNQRAEDLLASTSALSCTQNRLIVSCASTQKDLLTAIQDTLSARVDYTSPRVIKIQRVEQLPLKVIPVRLNPLRALGSSSRVMLLIYDPQANLTIDAEYLEHLFDLTTTEASIAARLAEGLSIAEIAQLRRCSPSTVRTHVKRLFMKTQTTRQGELVQIILTSPAISVSS